MAKAYELVIDTRIVKKHNQAETQRLLKWSKTSAKDVTYEPVWKMEQ